MSRRERMRPVPGLLPALMLFLLAGVAQRGEAQRPEPRVFGGAPAAVWIAHQDVSGEAFGVFHFRRILELPARPETFVVHVSADNRYRLFVNGQTWPAR